MAKQNDKEFQTVLGNPQWYMYKDKPSFKLFSLFAWLGLIGITGFTYSMGVPLITNLIPPTHSWLKWLTWIIAAGIPALTILSQPKRFFNAVRAKIGSWYRKLFKPSPREQVRLNIEMLKEKVRLLAEIASQMSTLWAKWENLRQKYDAQLDVYRKNIVQIKAFIDKNENSADKAMQVRVIKAKKDLVLAYKKAENVFGFVKDISEKVDSLHARMVQAEEVRDRESHELELLQGKYELLLAQSELGAEAEATQKRLQTLSAGTSDLDYYRDISEVSLIGETEQKLAMLDVTLNSVNVEQSDMIDTDMEAAIDIGEQRSSEYMDHA